MKEKLGNAKELESLRNVGRLPHGLIVVSMIGRVHLQNFVLIAKPGIAYDWTPIAGASVELLANAEVPWDDVVAMLTDIAAACPAKLLLGLYPEGPKIDCGDLRTVRDPAGDFAMFDWFPVSVGGVRGGSDIVKALYAEIATGRIPVPFEEAMGYAVALAEERQ